jgi:hypothetical protein
MAYGLCGAAQLQTLSAEYSPDRRHLYAPAVEVLTLTQRAVDDYHNLAFPRIKRLNIDYAVSSDSAVLASILDSCGAQLCILYLTAQRDGCI